MPKLCDKIFNKNKNHLEAKKKKHGAETIFKKNMNL